MNHPLQNTYTFDNEIKKHLYVKEEADKSVRLQQSREKDLFIHISEQNRYDSKVKSQRYGIKLKRYLIDSPRGTREKSPKYSKGRSRETR